MNHLKNLLKTAQISSSMLSEAMGMPIRTLAYHLTTGRMPYALIYKIHVITGVPIDQLVPKYLAENWLFLYDEQIKQNKPRGKKKGWKPGDNEKWAENLELDEPPAEQLAPEQKVKIKAKKIADVPKTVIPDIPKTVSAPRETSTKKKPSIADLMKANPAPEPVEEGTPDFSNIDDSVFQTSMDVANNAIRKRR